MAITLYGAPQSSTGRCRWMIEETGVAYEYVHVDVRGGQTRAPELLALNPNGKIPILVDDGFVLYESMAINYYLAERYATSLLGTSPQERAQTMQWSLWGITNLQPRILEALFHGTLLPESMRNPQLASQGREEAQRFLSVLERHLEAHEYLVAERFTVADINAGSIVNIAVGMKMDAAFPRTREWLARLKARPAYARAAERD
jgi:glutathione S-transferase